MTVAYGVTVVLAITRIGLWSFLIFGLLPRLVFGTQSRGGTANLVRMAAASIVIVHVLVVSRLFDLFSLGAGLALLGFGHAVVVRRRPLRVPLLTSWPRLAAASLDLCEVVDHREQRARLRRRRETRILGRLPRLKDLVVRRAATPWTLLFLSVGAGTAWVHLGDAILHPASDLPDYGAHLSWMKAVADHRLYVDGVYPHGAEALLQVVRRFVAVDEALLLRVAPGMLGCLTVGFVYWAIRRLEGDRGHALVGAALFGVFSLAGWLPVIAPPSGDTIGMTAALVFVPPAIVFAADAMAEGGRRALALLAQAVACLFLIQPFVGVLVVAGLVGSCLVSLVLGGRGLRRAAAVAVVAAAAGTVALVPLGIALVSGRRPVRGVLAPDQLFLGMDLRPPSLGAPLPTGDPALLAAVVAAGIVIGLVRFGPWRREGRPSDPGRMTLVAVLFTTIALILPSRFGLPALLAPNEVGRVLTPLACIVLALALDDLGRMARAPLDGWLRRRGRTTERDRRWPALGSTGSFVATTVILLGLAVTGLPLPVTTGEREQPDAAVLQLSRINGRFPPRTWTVVSSAAALPRVQGNGFFFGQTTFVDAYQPEAWRYDPRRPELALPTTEVFIFVRTLPVAAPRPSSLDAAVARPAPFVTEDVAVRPRLLSWVERYRATRDDLRTFHQEDGLVVFWIHRSRAEEEAVLRQIDQERRRR